LSEQAAAVPPSHTDLTVASNKGSPVLASHARIGLCTLPLLGHEQLGLQQSQYPVVHVPVIHSSDAGVVEGRAADEVLEGASVEIAGGEVAAVVGVRVVVVVVVVSVVVVAAAVVAVVVVVGGDVVPSLAVEVDGGVALSLVLGVDGGVVLSLMLGVGGCVVFSSAVDVEGTVLLSLALDVAGADVLAMVVDGAVAVSEVEAGAVDGGDAAEHQVPAQRPQRSMESAHQSLAAAKALG